MTTRKKLIDVGIGTGDASLISILNIDGTSNSLMRPHESDKGE